MEVLVNYDEVYNQVIVFRNQLAQQLEEARTRHHQIQFAINELDSNTNANLRESMIENEKKASMTVDILCSLLLFINDAAQTVELKEILLKQLFLS
ncbi:MAG: hypothetical protein FWE05_13350 [Defluviitaleaceae bacterium]|nr:hypothetical protein [Defluviitaleaceae bacterium]